MCATARACATRRCRGQLIYRGSSTPGRRRRTAFVTEREILRRPAGPGTLASVSDLLPNLDALLQQLVGDAAGVRDARALTEVVARAQTEGDLDAALDTVIAMWRQP